MLLTARAQPGQPQVVEQKSMARLRVGQAAFVLLAGILIFAPTVAFGWIYGFNAVLAYWASVCLLVVMTFGGLFLIFTDKNRASQNT